MSVRFVVPNGVDDPSRVSGGNVYDLRLAAELAARGWDVRMTQAAAEPDALARALGAMPDGALVLIDGLLAVAAPDALAAHAGRLRSAVLAHMVASAIPGATDAATERTALRGAHRVIVTSAWTRAELIRRRLVEPGRITVARPGTDPAASATGSASGRRLLCVGAVAPHKGQDLLVEALAHLDGGDDWSCGIVGSLDVDPRFTDRLRRMIRSAGLEGRITLRGVLTGGALVEEMHTCDLLVAPSRSESYGMAVAEALAHGIPVIAARLGGIPEAVDGSAAGVLIPPDDAIALRDALHQWCGDASWRMELAAAARRDRASARTWEETADDVAAALDDEHASVAALRRRRAG